MLPDTVFAIVFSGLLCGLVLWAMVTDWRYMAISNRCVLAVTAFGLLKLAVQLAMGATWAVLGVQLLIAFVVFALGFALFWFGAMGGGDVKLLAALGLWLSLGQWPLFFVVMAVVGGLLGGLALLLTRYPQFIPASYVPPSWLGCLKAGQPVVAYGLAIGAGVLAVTLPVTLPVTLAQLLKWL